MSSQSTISSIPILYASIKNNDYANVLADSKRILIWKCPATSVFGGCGKEWKESVVKRARFKLCPECSPHKTRASIVSSATTPTYSPPIKLKREKTPSKVMCEVCCLDKTSLQFMTCNACEYKACKMCVKEYAMTCVGEARCMNVKCQVPFTKHFLATNLTKVWLKTVYQTKIKRGWIEHELTRIPETMRLVEIMKRHNEITTRKDELSSTMWIREEIQIGDVVAFQSSVNIHHPNYLEYNTLFTESYRLRAQMNAYPREVEFDEPQPPQIKYIQVCPKDGCIGLVAEENEILVCKACDTSVCVKCHVILTTSHECKDTDIKSVKAMKRDTKPCPSCAVPIHKIDGCDQMWCVVCNTAFSWTRGVIEKGPVHNPHYFNWLRSQSANGIIPRNDVVRNECGLTNGDIEQVSVAIHKHCSEKSAVLFGRLLEAAQRQLLHSNIDSSLHIARAAYILKLQTRSEWEKQVIRFYKISEYENSEKAIQTTLQEIANERITTCVAAILVNTDDEFNVKNAYNKCMDEMNTARVYFNQALVDENPDCSFECIQIYNEEWLKMNYAKYRKQEQRIKQKEPQ